MYIVSVLWKENWQLQVREKHTSYKIVCLKNVFIMDNLNAQKRKKKKELKEGIIHK